MSREISFFLEGRIIVIERFEDETDASFAERSSFILWFRNDPIKFKEATDISFYHSNKMFLGTTYRPDVEAQVLRLREEVVQMKLQLVAQLSVQ